jgi:hypothetical protein
MTSCGKTPDDEQKIDWFMASVHEHIYDAAHAHCTNKLLEGDLTYAIAHQDVHKSMFPQVPAFPTVGFKRKQKIFE